MTEPRLAAPPEATSLASTVALSPDGGRRLEVVAGVARLDGAVLASGVVAAAMLDAGAWLVVRGADADRLCRFGAGGAAIGSPTGLGRMGDVVRMTADRTGARVALVEGDRAYVVRERGGGPVVEELGARGRDWRVLLAGRGVYERRGGALVSRSGAAASLEIPADLATSAVVAGAIVFDGAAAVIELESHGVRHLIAYDPRRGDVRCRVRIGDAALAAVSERSGVVVIGRDRHVALLDVRTGRCAHERIFQRRIAAVAASADGARFAVLDEDGALIELAAHLAELGSASQPTTEAAPEPAPPAPPPAPVPAPVAPEPAESVGATPDDPPAIEEPVVAAPADDVALHALHPRPARPALDRDAAVDFLDDAFELVSAWCRAAAAAARSAGDGDGDGEIAGDDQREASARFERWRGEATPLAAIAADFGLSPLARAILLIAAAPHLWGELAHVYGGLAADPSRALVDELLVCQILELDRADRIDVARELEDGAPLVRHGLVTLGRAPRPFAALDVPHAVIRRLTGDRFTDPGVGVLHRAADRGLDELHLPREPIAALARELARPPAADEVRVVVRGRRGAGRRTVAAVLARRAGRELGVVELAGASGDAIAALRRDLRECHLRGWIACVSGLDRLAAADEAQREQVRAVLDAHPAPLFLRCEPGASAPIAPGHLAVELPPLAVAERAAVWRDALDRHGLPADDAAALADRYAVGPGVVEAVVAAAAADGDPRDAAARIDRLLRQQRAERLGRLATRVERTASWRDLVLPDDLLDSIRELVARVQLRSTVLDTWGMDRVASTGRAVVALLQGGPGTGKTMVAGVVARELGYDLYRVDLSRVTSKWIGETEKNLAEVFDAADDGQCILLFDEADSLFGKRTDVRSSNDRHANLEVNYLLQRLDTFEGIAILTTNMGTAIDPAFKRRLSLHLQFPFPDEDERERLWRAHLPAALPVAGDLDLAGLAHKYQLSGGYIRNAALRAAYLAAAERTPVTADHLRRAVQAVYRDRAKVAATGTLE